MTIALSHQAQLRALGVADLIERDVEPIAGQTGTDTDTVPVHSGNRATESETDRRIADWRAALPDDEIWSAKLRSLDLSASEFEVLLGHRLGASNSATPFDLPVPAEAVDIERSPLAWLIEPFVSRMAHQIEGRLGQDRRHLARPMLDAFGDYVSGRLRFIAERCFVLELNVARLMGDTIGATAEQRLRSFAEDLGRPDRRLAFFDAYPVLARAFCEICDDAVSSFAEFFDRLEADLPRIAQHLLDGDKPAIPLTATFGLGDSHRRGRSVAIVTFDSGQKVVYKPRSVEADLCVQKAQSWIADRVPGLDFRLPGVLKGGNGPYGWMEFVEEEPCVGEQARRRFYFRQGAHLAIFRTLGVVDLHRENLIAAGDQPIFVDVEAMMHPELSVPPTERIEQCLHAAYLDSVLATGLLPSTFGSTEALDLSGFAGRNDQQTPHQVLQWGESGTDAWHYRRRSTVLQDAQHLARDEQGDVTNAFDYIEEIRRGFALTHRAIAADHRELTAPGGLIDQAADAPVRVVARSTSSYGVLLQESTHPDMAADALSRDQLFDELWLPTARNPQLAHLVPSEQRDLRRFDIPIFTATPASTSLFDAEGFELPGVFDEPGAAAAARRTMASDEADLTRQLWLIDASLTVRAVNDDQPLFVRPASASRQTGLDSMTPQSPLEAAVAIGDRLLDLSYTEPTRFWLTVERTGAQRWKIARAGLDLYGGLPGIALFLDALGACTGTDRFTEAAKQTIDTVIDEVEVTPPEGIGLYTGLGGIVLTLSRLAEHWGDQRVAEAATRAARRMTAGIADDLDFDITDGSAGAVIALAALHRLGINDGVVDQGLQMACERLVTQARSQQDGVGWHIRLNPEAALAGLAHGSAGIIWALGVAHHLNGREDVLPVIEAALSYERSLFDPVAGNWRDLRSQLDPEGENNPKYMASWCHGAPGIALARAGLHQLLPDLDLEAEIVTASETTRRHLSDDAHSLCHGLFGNLDCLLTADRLLSGSEPLQPTPPLVAVEKWRTGIPIPVPVPGLLVGLAGIGHGLLRLARPSEVESVLLPYSPLPDDR